MKVQKYSRKFVVAKLRKDLAVCEEKYDNAGYSDNQHAQAFYDAKIVVYKEAIQLLEAEEEL